MNAGISGWTTAEIVPAWFLTLQDFEPDVVVVHEAVNDLEPRFFQRFEPDYSHWRKPVDVRPVAGLERWLVSASRLYLYLRLKGGHAPEILDVCADRSGPKEPLMARGELPHGTSLAFRRNVLSIARSARDEGRTVVLMTLPTSPTADIGAFWRYGVHENNQHLRALCAEHGYLLADAEQVFAARPELAAEFIDLVHVQPQGNRAKAEIVAEALTGWLDGLSKEGARPPHLGWELQQRGAHRSR
jgi:lysophospholipase L1-like esterase